MSDFIFSCHYCDQPFVWIYPDCYFVCPKCTRKYKVTRLEEMEEEKSK